METKPVMLLDVDGVLNVQFSETRVRFRLGRYGLMLMPSRFARRFMKWAWPRFEVFWLTAWFQYANAIARWAGLEDRPFLGQPSISQDDWKLSVARKRFGRLHRRPIVWVEDGLFPETQRWVSARRNIVYVETQPAEGVTRRHVGVIEKRLTELDA